MTEVYIKSYTLDDKLSSEAAYPIPAPETRYLYFRAEPAEVSILEVYPDSVRTGPFIYTRSGNKLNIRGSHFGDDDFTIVELTDKELVLQRRHERGIPVYEHHGQRFTRVR